MKHPVLTQRIEAGFLLAASLYLYFYLGFSWVYFVPALFLVDVSMVGYLFNNSLGAYVYNIGHSFIIPSMLLIIGAGTSSICIGLGLVWIAHIGMDRALGFGLKNVTSFTDTHLGKIGKK